MLAFCFHCINHAHIENVQIRGVPAETHAVLRRRAAEAGTSMHEYLLSILNDVASRPTVPEVLARAGGRSGGRDRTERRRRAPQCGEGSTQIVVDPTVTRHISPDL
jgi:antitoxin FitA